MPAGSTTPGLPTPTPSSGPVGGGGEVAGEARDDVDGGGAGAPAPLDGAAGEDLAREVDEGGLEAGVVAEVEADA